MIKLDDIVTLAVRDKDLKVARDELGEDYNRTLRKRVDVEDYEEAKLWGLVGQVMAAKFYGKARFSESTTDYDMILDGKKIEVKTRHTRMTATDQIDLSYRGVIRADALKRQSCEGYVFCLLNLPLRTVWLIGWISKGRFLAKATFQKKGERFDDSSKWKVRGDCWAIKYRELSPVNELC